MTKESIGSSNPENLADNDRDGIADQAERDFEEDSKIQPSPDETAEIPARRARSAPIAGSEAESHEENEGAAQQGDDDDGLMESARKASTATAPGWSN